jgi:transposase InsO family protein
LGAAGRSRGVPRKIGVHEMTLASAIAGSRPVSAPDLIGRLFSAEAPGQKWCGDVTYVKTWDGWAYLATGFDPHSRRLVGRAIADTCAPA